MELTAKRYSTTTWTCYIGCVTEGVIGSFVPFLFIALRDQFGLSFTALGALIMVGFISQIVVDFTIGHPVDRYGFRPFVIVSLIACIFGLMLFATMPILFPQSAYVWLVIATVLYSMAVGMLEVVLSSIVNSIPSDNPGAAMVKLHAFFAWGLAITTVGTALGLFAFGAQNWPYVVLFWAILPVVTLILFIRSPLPQRVPQSQLIKSKDLIKNPVFILGFFTIFFGAGAQINLFSWLPSFLERGLGMPKLAGDLLGAGGFAVFTGVARVIYSSFGKKIDLNILMIVGSVVTTLCYLTIALTGIAWASILACCLAGAATAFMWPGSLSITAAKIPIGGTLLFALMALGGDIGIGACSWSTGIFTDFFTARSALTGLAAEQYGLRMAMLVCVAYPVMCLFFCSMLKRQKKT